MVLLAQVIGALYGFLAVVIGAFGAHALKKRFSEDQQKSFETGVKYQMYHALVLLVLGFNLNMDQPHERYMAHSFIWGTFLFSFSIYGLCLSAAFGKKWKVLGPITPLGGLLLALGWALLLYHHLHNFF